MSTIAQPAEKSQAPITTGAPKTGRRLDFIDAIRGTAAVLVMLEHYSERWFPTVTDPVTNYVNLGRVGVITFFIVSGFVIPMSIEHKSNLKAFWISRVCRLYPAYWTALALFVLFSAGASYFGHPEKLHELTALGPRVWIPNLFIAQMFLRVKDIIPVAWTLGLEWIIYISASFLHARGWLTKTQVLLITTAGLALIGGIALPMLVHKRVPFAAIAALTSGAAGLALYRLFQNQITKKQAWTLVSTLVVIVLAGSWINYGLYPSKTESNLTITPFSEITSTFLGYALFLVPAMAAKVKFPTILTWFGRISYSIYITHDIVPIPTFLTGAGGFIFQIAETLLVSYLCYRFVESPGIALGKRLVAKYATKPASTEPA
jgi:peptidoglycan/LPS O-acetylase OafA/YrhL